MWGALVGAGLLLAGFDAAAADCRLADPDSKGAHVVEICWLQFGGTNLDVDGTTPLEFNLPDGSRLTFDAVVDVISGSGLQATQAPTWSGSQFSGSTGFYTIYTPNQSALYSTAESPATNTVVVLENIHLYAPDGVESGTNFELILADAESTNNGEWLDFGVTGGSPLQLLEWLGDNSANNLTYGPVSDTTTSQCAALGWADCIRLNGKTGTANAAVFSTTRGGSGFKVLGQINASGGKQGFTFGLRWGGVRLRTVFPNGRMEPTDQVGYRVLNVKGESSGALTTSGTATVPSQYTSSMAIMPGNVLTLDQTMAAGSVSTLAQYDKTIACSNAKVTSTTVIPNGAYSPSARPTIDLAELGDNVQCTLTNIPRLVDLRVTEAAPGTVAAGGEVVYTVTVRNAGTHAATDAPYRHQLPVGFTNAEIVSCVAEGSAACGPASVTGDASSGFVVQGSASLPAGQQIVLTVRSRAPVTPGTYASSSSTELAAADTTVGEPVARRADNSASASTVVEAAADLSVTKTVAAGPHYPGGILSYTITVANGGPSAADSVSVSDTLPAGTRFAGLTVPGGWTATTPAMGAGGTITVTNASFASGATATFTLQAQVDESVADGTVIANTATVSSPVADPAGANNAATVNATVDGAADLGVSKTLQTPGPYLPGQSVTYSILVTNAGPSVANAQVVDTPTNLTITSVSGAGCSALPCTIPSLASGGSATLSVVATIDAPGSFDNGASVTGDVHDPSPADNTDPGGNGGTAAPLADLAVTKTRTSASPAVAGSTVQYSIVVANNGPSAVTGATLQDTVPPQLSGVTWTCAPVGACSASSGTGDISLLLSLAAAGSATVTVSGVAPSTTPSTIDANTATITPPTGTVDPDAGNNSATTSSIPVSARAIDAVADAGVTGGAAGGTAVANVLGNDVLAGAAATTSSVELTVVTPASHANVVLDTATGAIDVAPGTPTGDYTIGYRICERANPGNCDTATATVTVTTAPIAAADDTAAPMVGASGGTAIATVLGNDSLDGQVPTPAQVTLSVVNPATHAGVALDTDTGAVTVAAGTPAGTYAVTYRICERLNPTSCATAVASVTVVEADLVAGDDSGSADGRTGGVAVADVLADDTVDGAPATLANVALEQLSTTHAGVTLDPATGAVAVAAGTPAGSYRLEYRICERLNPANCGTATVDVRVEAASVDAVDDTTPPVEGGTGATGVANVLANDTLGGGAVLLADVELEQVSAAHAGITLDPVTGMVDVAAGTPSGSHRLEYRLCERLNPVNCDTAAVTVVVVAPSLGAVDDTGTTTQNTAVTIDVLANDTLEDALIDRARAVLTIEDAPSNGTLSIDEDGAMVYTPAANYSGPDTFTYRLCDRINPTVCTTATVTVTVTPNEVEAVDASVTTPQTGPVVIDPVASTRNGGGAPLDPGSVRVVTPPANGTVLVGPDGTLTYTPDELFFGSETFEYRICDRSMPTPVCDVATVTVVVAMQAPQLRLVKSTRSRAVKIGDLVRYTVIVENTGISPAQNATVVDVPPRGFTLVDGSVSVDDADDGFAIASADPIRLTGVDVPVGGRATVAYLLRVGAGVGRGSHTNTVTAIDATGTGVSNTATADVIVEGDPMTEDSLILGTVFLDRDGDGIQEDGEPGLAGVRIASVEGLLIETDVHGRYHVAGISAGHALRGRNFILKVDAATLPPGTTFTTANPLVRRITPGIPVRFDFGVRLPSDDAQAGN